MYVNIIVQAPTWETQPMKTTNIEHLNNLCETKFFLAKGVGITNP